MSKGATPRKSGKPLPATKPIRSGASASHTKVSHRLEAYWAHHRISAIDSLRRLLATPLRSILTALMLGIALALPALLYLALANVQQLSGQWAGSNQLSVYLRAGANERAVESLQQKIIARAEVVAATIVTPEQGLAEFGQHSGFGRLLDGVATNPLPYVVLVQPSDKLRNASQLQPLQLALQQEPIVDEVRLDMAWLDRLNQVMHLGQRLALGLGLLLGLGMLLAIGNTLRLAIENRREEIVVVKLVGGTDAFVRRPFLYTGFWYGFAGGVAALLLVWLGLYLVAAPVASLAASYQSQFALASLSGTDTLFLLTVAASIGWLGAWLAVGRHLHDIQPK